MNYTDPIRSKARETPDAPALFRHARAGPNAHTITTYRDFDRTIDALAARFASAGIARGSVCALALDGHGATLLSALALGRMGAIASAADDAEADWALVGTGPEGAQARARRIVVPAEWVKTPPSDVAIEPVPSFQDPDAIALIARSSGTTGRPKRVPITHAQMLARMARVRAGNPIPPQGRLACPQGPSAGYGYRHMVCALAGGSSILLCNGIARTLADIETIGATHLVVSPLILSGMVRARESAAGPLPSLEMLEVGGSRLTDALRDAAVRVICPTVLLSYGSSELGVVAKGPAADVAGIPGAVGRIFDDLEVQAVDEADRPLPPGREGVLRMRGSGAVDRYLGSPQASARAFRGGWFYPGDIGFVTADRVLVVRGREREVINAGGVKIAPTAIEDALAGIPGAIEIAAFGVPDATGIDRPWLAVTPGADFDAKAFEAACKERLRAYAPAGVLALRELPRNPNGKIVRAELAAMAQDLVNRRKEA